MPNSRGFKCTFDRGCLSLWFNFRRDVGGFSLASFLITDEIIHSITASNHIAVKPTHPVIKLIQRNDSFSHSYLLRRFRGGCLSPEYSLCRRILHHNASSSLYNSDDSAFFVHLAGQPACTYYHTTVTDGGSFSAIVVGCFKLEPLVLTCFSAPQLIQIRYFLTLPHFHVVVVPRVLFHHCGQY